jgi:recombinational DNA repair protein RecT
LGLQADLTHQPDWEAADRGPLKFVYSVAKLKDGGIQFEVMSRAEIEKVRAQSKAGSSGPWVNHFEEMAKKTVIRRLFKYLPVSIEIAQAVGLDEQAEAGLIQDNPLIIDSETGEITDNEEPLLPPNIKPINTTKYPDSPQHCYAQFAERLNKTVDAEIADLIVDEARSSLPDDQYLKLVKLYQGKFKQR